MFGLALKQTPNYDEVKLLIEQVLAQDPRPAYKQNKEDNKTYFISINNLNVEWQVSGLCIIVIQIQKYEE